MGKIIRRILMAVLLVVFIFCVGTVGAAKHQYSKAQKLYDDIAQQFTAQSTSDDPNAAPITVDFAGLQATNEEIVGWIYCEDTNINYPILKGTDNNFYLHRASDKTYNFNGSIFVESKNRDIFTDSNTIIYGHNMKNGTMFQGLENWKEQSYYDTHPVIWILTPERDYKLKLFSGYTTSATSDTYQIFSGAGADLNNYLNAAVQKSDFQAKDVQLQENGKYVLLTTCAYVFDDARYVLHGMLEPAESAGGVVQ